MATTNYYILFNKKTNQHVKPISDKRGIVSIHLKDTVDRTKTFNKIEHVRNFLLYYTGYLDDTGIFKDNGYNNRIPYKPFKYDDGIIIQEFSRKDRKLIAEHDVSRFMKGCQILKEPATKYGNSIVCFVKKLYVTEGNLSKLIIFRRSKDKEITKKIKHTLEILNIDKNKIVTSFITNYRTIGFVDNDDAFKFALSFNDEHGLDVFDISGI